MERIGPMIVLMTVLGILAVAIAVVPVMLFSHRESRIHREELLGQLVRSSAEDVVPEYERV